ncbi:MAG: hypothetical protein GX060_04065 [Firmicutes bacterium]|nr:hypothetical protein [Bacillota bacterium]
MTHTIGSYWFLILFAVLAALYIWYWTMQASRRAVEQLGRRQPKRYNFSWRTRKGRRVGKNTDEA